MSYIVVTVSCICTQHLTHLQAYGITWVGMLAVGQRVAVVAGTGIPDLGCKATTYSQDMETLATLRPEACITMLIHACSPRLGAGAARTLFQDPHVRVLVASACGVPGFVEWIRRSVLKQEILVGNVSRWVSSHFSFHLG
jgi:hypothetical protein